VGMNSNIFIMSFSRVPNKVKLVLIRFLEESIHILLQGSGMFSRLPARSTVNSIYTRRELANKRTLRFIITHLTGRSLSTHALVHSLISPLSSSSHSFTFRVWFPFRLLL
jgi:hypothetical protein